MWLSKSSDILQLSDRERERGIQNKPVTDMKVMLGSAFFFVSKKRTLKLISKKSDSFRYATKAYDYK